MLTIILGTELVSDEVSDLQFSSTDPGGYETCTFTLPNQRAGDHIGETVIVYEGLSVAWYGRVNEPGSDYTQVGKQQFSCTGLRSRLSDNQTSMVFIDRDLSQWGSPTRARQASALTVYNPFSTPTIAPDQNSGSPGLVFSVDGPIQGASGGECEAMYDAGQGNTIGAVLFTGTTFGITPNATWVVQMFSSSNGATLSAVSTDTDGASVALATYTVASVRYLHYIVRFASTSAVDTQRHYALSDLAAVGSHGLTLQGSSGAEGFAPGDIVQWVEDQVALLDSIIAADQNDYIIPHLVYKTPVPYEQIVDDMAKLLGWHWGVWEPPFGSQTPVLYFTPPPVDPTAWTHVTDVTGLQLSQQFSELYNRVRVHFTDVAGSPGYVTVTKSIPRLGDVTRTVDVDLGTSTAAIATQYGQDYLELTASNARAVGQCVLPATVMTANGIVPSHTLKPGRDRLRIVGVRDTSSSLIDEDTRRFDTFHIARLNAVQQQGGQVETTVELDAGANLLDVLNARLAIATQLGGV